MDRPYVNLQLVQAKNKTKECPDISYVSFLCFAENKWNLDPFVAEFPPTLHDLEMICCRLPQRPKHQSGLVVIWASALWQLGGRQVGWGGDPKAISQAGWAPGPVWL